MQLTLLYQHHTPTINMHCCPFKKFPEIKTSSVQSPLIGHLNDNTPDLVVHDVLSTMLITIFPPAPPSSNTHQHRTAVVEHFITRPSRFPLLTHQTMQSSTFRFYQLKVSAKRLPGRAIRLDPLAVVFVGGAGSWTEVGRTEKRPNEWNPNFATSISLPADTDQQRRAQIRVDFYNKDMVESRFLGTCEVNFSALIHAQGRGIELELKTPESVSGHPRVFLTALEGYAMESEQAQVHLSFQLMQTNFYGVKMRLFYEISRAGAGQWHPVYKSDHIMIDEQGWGQFPVAKIGLRDLTANEEGAGLLISLYRFKRIGSKRLLGHFQTTVKELNRKSAGDFIQFTANTREDIVSADVQVLHSQKTGLIYEFGLKLINVQWNATYLTPENIR